MCDAADALEGQEEVRTDTAGLTIPAWCEGVPMSVPAYYLVPKELRPRGVKIGRQFLILESQRDWLERVAQLGGVKLVPYHERPGYKARKPCQSAS